MARKIRRVKPSYEGRRSLTIYERDNWICQLCGGPVDKKLFQRNQDDSPTEDHIIPRSLGGRDTVGNIQLAHKRCNAAKGASLDSLDVENCPRCGKLRLVGNLCHSCGWF